MKGGSQGRPLNEGDIAKIFAAARQRPDYKPRAKASMIQVLRLRNPWRLRRLRSDLAWARKQLEKAGYDPEEIRWLM